MSTNAASLPQTGGVGIGPRCDWKGTRVCGRRWIGSTQVKTASTSKQWGPHRKKPLINPIRHLQIFGRPSCSLTNPEHANALA